jgi:geranylgeranylglycerol-phosphate geranylgeranyltransferase
MTHTKIRGLLRLFRFELPFAAGVCVVLGEILALGGFPPVREIVLGFLSYFFISSTALILNDVFDYEIDRVNAPDRPLPSGAVTRKEAVWLAIVVALLGFAVAAMIGLSALLLVLVVWGTGVLYNWRFKKAGLFGNLLVCISVGSTFVFGGFAVGHPTDRLVWWLGVLTMFFDLAEEIAADAMDEQGDRMGGSRSVAIVYGRQRALQVSGAIFTLVILISFVPFVLHWIHWVYLAPIVFMDGVIIYSVFQLLRPASLRGRHFIRLIYLSGTAAVLAIIVLRSVVNE